MERRSKPTADIIAELAGESEKKIYKGGNRPTYGEVSAELKQEAISNAVSAQRKILNSVYERGKVDLRHTDEVRAQADAYLEACEQTGTVPTLLGLSAALGVSRSRVYYFCQQNPNHETAMFIETFRTVSAAVIAQGALSRTLDNSTSIFLLKNSGQQLADKHELEMTAHPYVSADKDVTERYEPYLSSRGINCAGMTDDEIKERYFYERYTVAGEDMGIVLDDDLV